MPVEAPAVQPGLFAPRCNLVFGLRDGLLHHVDAVPRGARCGCVCPSCRRPLVARHGDKLRHHFAHLDAECDYSMADLVRDTAARVLLTDRCVRVPASRLWSTADYVVRTGPRELADLASFARNGYADRWTLPGGALCADEAFLDRDGADVLLMVRGRPLAVQIRLAAPRSPLPGLSTLELDLSAWSWTWENITEIADLDALWRNLVTVVQSGAHTRWLLNLQHDRLRARALALADARAIEHGRVEDCPVSAHPASVTKRCASCRYLLPSSRDVLGADPGLLCLGSAKVAGWRALPPED